MTIHKSGEDYLEAILMIRQDTGYCRSVDVAHHLSVSKASVSVAVNTLKEGGLVVMDDEGQLGFTEEGLQIAQRVYSRHLLMTELLMFCGVPEDVAKVDACKLEHDLSPETTRCIKTFLAGQKGTEAAPYDDAVYDL